MPNINLGPAVRYQPGDPYYFTYDNLPIDQITQNLQIVIDAVNVNAGLISGAEGSAGSLPNRLNQSLEQSGALKVDAVDATLHNIAMHNDGSISGISYVRMLQDERDKLGLIADEATKLNLTVTTASYSYDFGVVGMPDVEFVNSSVISWNVSGSQVSANLLTPIPAQSSYGVTPLPTNLSTPDYINYVTPVPFVTGSLRVYINGVRIFEGVASSVYVPNNSVTSWVDQYFTITTANTTFALHQAITALDVIRVDFEAS